MKRNCLICGNEFSAYKSVVKKGGAKYCSCDCYYEMKRTRGDRVEWTDDMKLSLSKKYSGVGNPMFGKVPFNKGKKRPNLTGDKHPGWKGGRYTNKNGYIIIENETETNGKKVREHRKVMEDYLKRNLTNNEIVHHKDEDRANNDISNLEIMSRAEHVKLHREKNERL